MPLESFYVISPKYYTLVMCMNTLSAAARKSEEEMANVGDNNNQVPQLEDVSI